MAAPGGATETRSQKVRSQKVRSQKKPF